MAVDRLEQLYVAPHVRHVWVGDRVVILDLRTESYFALDPIGSVMWRELVREQSRTACLENLHGELSVEAGRLARDLDGLAKKCLEAGWLVSTCLVSSSTTPALPRGRPAQRFLTLRAWWTLLRVTRSITRRGFTRTYDELSQGAAPVSPSDRDPEALLSAAVLAFARAEEFFYLKAAPADCLPRSLALFRFLRAVGLPVEHCISVQQFPFTAHAWTQYRGRIVHDDPENQNRYTVIARMTP